MKFLIQHILPFVILMVMEVLYFKIAERYKIIDKPNERSSHSLPTIRGGGVIFLLAAILFFLWSKYQYPYLLAALLLSGIVSFIDDIKSLPNILKFGAHIGSVLLLFEQCGILTNLHPFYLIAIGILVIGVINAYNFMDGINAITGFYSLAVLIPLFITEEGQNRKLLELFSILSLVVFNIFNARTKARCFAGDVGSISMAILVIFLLITRIQDSNSFMYLGMLLIYGIDSVFTIIQRLFQHENIFKPHRKHLYQYLSNEKKIPHIYVSAAYSALQLLINLSIVYALLGITSMLTLSLILIVFYWILKAPFIGKRQTADL